jgi:plasmid stabilization system protein ParE
MTSGFRILWTDQALSELEDTIAFLETNWTEKELRNLAKEIENNRFTFTKSPSISKFRPQFSRSSGGCGQEKYPVLSNQRQYS